MESFRILKPSMAREVGCFYNILFCMHYLGDLDHRPMARDMLGFSWAESARR